MMQQTGSGKEDGSLIEIKHTVMDEIGLQGRPDYW